MKAVTAYKNYLKTRAKILQERVSYLLGTDGELSITITYKIVPKRENKEYEIFREARRKAEETYEERLLSRGDNGDIIQ